MRKEKAIAPLFTAVALLSFCGLAQAQSAIVISQVYGGGGNAGALLRNDFVELFNRGTATVDVSGWTVQYASANGSSWDRATLSGSIQPGQYYLIQLAAGAGGTTALPGADASSGLNLSATSGKLALVSTSTALMGTSPGGSEIVDFVGYGEANAAENQPTPTLTNTMAALRRSGGCTDTNNNQSDFTVGSPSPRNSRSPLAPCFTNPAPQISTAGVTNAATFAAGPVAPGEILTIFGSALGPERVVSLELTPDRQFIRTALSGTRVLFDGLAAPIVYTSAGQVSAIVPYSVGSRRSTNVQVEYEGRLSDAVTLGVAATAPGIFTADASGRGLGAVLNQDYSVNGPATPAAKGSVIIVYATGGGQTSPLSEDGRIVTTAAAQAAAVSGRIGGRPSEVLYAGAAPGLVSGVLQINIRVPDSVPGGLQSIEVTVGSAASQPGVVIAVAGDLEAPGTGSQIEARLQELRRQRTPAVLPELPTDRDEIPANWLGLVSWNIQVGGTSPAANSTRPPMVQAALGSMFKGSYHILAAQEISSTDNADMLRDMLPGGTRAWTTTFTDTSDSMDNGFWHQSSIVMRDSFALLTTDRPDAAGRLIPDDTRVLHPPQVAQFEIGDFDFTLINVHLTFADGDTSESVRELRNVLEYLDWYFDQPDHDPDVVVCGDFNIPSVLSGQAGRNGLMLDDVFDRDPRFQIGERRFAVTVHEPTSRSPVVSGGGAPARNYDHCVISADVLEEFIQARRVSTNILTDHPEDPEVRLTSDHFPIVALFKTRGEGISLDLRRRIRP